MLIKRMFSRIKNYVYDHLLKVGLGSIVLFGLIAIFILPWAFTNFQWGLTSFDNTGQIGETINGIAGPFIALIGTFIIFLAFWAQLEFNKKQFAELERQKNKQREDNEIRDNEILRQKNEWRIERFENRFFELIKIHMQNRDNISITNTDGTRIEGREAMVQLFKELEYSYNLCEFLYLTYSINLLLPDKKTYENEDLLNLTYNFYYFGGSFFDDYENIINIQKKFDSRLIDAFKASLKEKRISFLQNKTYEIPPFQLGSKWITFDIKHKPFYGQISQLGHYYRHLFQTVEYVVGQPNELIDKVEKESYLRTLRAQLSDFEQLMLYYNALSGFGQPWIDKGYLTDYKMIRNIPIPLAYFCKSPEVKFSEELKSIPNLFEYLQG